MHSTKLKSMVQDFWQVSVVIICFCAYVTIWALMQPEPQEPPADDLVIEGEFTAHGPVLLDQHERKINAKDNEIGN